MSCDTGALMAVRKTLPKTIWNQLFIILFLHWNFQFFDGWELNKHFFPNELDHHLPLQQRFHEFCNHNAEWPFRQLRRRFRSTQNAALLQYLVPIRGSFVATVKFFENPERKYLIKANYLWPNESILSKYSRSTRKTNWISFWSNWHTSEPLLAPIPSMIQSQIRVGKWIEITLFVCLLACHILVEGTAPFYSLSNYGAKRNCTLTAMTPSAVTLRAINIGPGHETADYDVSSVHVLRYNRRMAVDRQKSKYWKP